MISLLYPKTYLPCRVPGPEKGGTRPQNPEVFQMGSRESYTLCLEGEDTLGIRTSECVNPY